MTRIRIFGVPTQTGIGTHSKSIYENGVLYKLSKYDFEFFNCQNPEDVSKAILSSEKTDLNIYFLPEIFANECKGLNIYYCVFEASRPSPGYHTWLDRFDFIFSPSKWGRDCMVAYGLSAEKIIVVPEGVNPFSYHPYFEKPRTSDQTFRIFMLGKYESRKGYEVALRAFRLAHEKLPFLELNIKPDWATPQGGVIPSIFLNLVEAYKDLPIVLMSGTVDYETIIGLYQRSDLFLFPSLCEGWGLPLIEAIASGIPVLSCDFVGHSEYLSLIDKYYFKIPYNVSPIFCETWKKTYFHSDGDWGNWADIDADELAEIIINAVQSDERLAMGLKASEIIRSEFSWARSTDKLLFEIALIIRKLNSK